MSSADFVTGTENVVRSLGLGMTKFSNVVAGQTLLEVAVDFEAVAQCVA